MLDLLAFIRLIDWINSKNSNFPELRNLQNDALKIFCVDFERYLIWFLGHPKNAPVLNHNGEATNKMNCSHSPLRPGN